MWRGHSDVFICEECARTVLPRFIADATWHHGNYTGSGDFIVEKIRSEFWRAFFYCERFWNRDHVSESLSHRPEAEVEVVKR
jgi:hypothetical protein